MSNQIDIIPSHAINKEQWDACIRHSSNPIIYAYSFYLDHLAENWHGIILNNYEAVMPIPWKKKWGIRYAYHVPFVQQLGYFGKDTEDSQSKMIRTFFNFVRYGDYTFNYGNSPAFITKKCCNFVLPLSKPYETTLANYKENLIRNLRKANAENFQYKETVIEEALYLYRSLYASKTPHVTNRDYEQLLQLARQLSKKGNAFARRIANGKNELLATALLLKDKHRIYNIMPATTSLGRNVHAAHLLYDRIINEFSASNLFFDFEGSDIPGIKRFYENLGAVNQPYTSIHFNHLPLPLRLLKR